MSLRSGMADWLHQDALGIDPKLLGRRLVVCLNVAEQLGLGSTDAVS